MKSINKIFIFFLILMGLISGVNAIITDNLVQYYTFDTDGTDSLGLYNTTELTGNSVVGKLGNGRDSLGSGSASNPIRVIRADTNLNNNDVTQCSWINFGTTPASAGYWVFRTGELDNSHFLLGISTGVTTNSLALREADSTYITSSDFTVSTGSYNFYCFLRAENGARLLAYENNVLIVNSSVTAQSPTGSLTKWGTPLPSTQNSYGVGTTILWDELGIWNRRLTNSEMTTLYNSGTGLTYPFGENSSAPTITSNLTTYYKTSNISIYLNTSTNTNISYILDNGFETTICNNCNSSVSINVNPKILNSSNGYYYSIYSSIVNAQEWCLENNFSSVNNYITGSTFDPNPYADFSLGAWLFTSLSFSYITSITCDDFSLNNLVDGLHNITWISTDANGQINITENFTIDTIKPTLNNNILSEYNFYNNINLNSSCSDSNLDYCNISINSQNFNITNLFNSTLNGNLSYTISAQDLAGNKIDQSGLTLINPYQYFYFKYLNGTNINTFSFGGKSFNNIAKFKLFNDILNIGNNSLIFEKLGLITSNFTISIENNSRINQTYNISQAKIILRLLNKDTSQIIPGENFSLDFIGDIGFNFWTNTGLKNISNLFFNNQNYQLIVRSNNYKTENVFFQFDNKQNLLIDVYLINKTSSSLGNVYIYSVDNFGAPLKSVIVQALQWDSSKSSYIKVSEIKTDDTGLSNLNIILDSKLYTFRAIYNNQIIDSVAQTIATNDNGKTIVLTLPTNIITNDYLFKDVIFNVSESFNNVSNISTIFFNWNNNAGNKINGCIAIYRLFVVNGDKKLIGRDCSLNSASANMIKAFFINSSNDILLSAEINDSNKYITIKTFIHYSNFQINKLLSDLDLSRYILPLLFILSIVIGIKLNVAMGGIGVIISGGIGLFLVPQFINKSIVAFIIFIGIALIVGGNKRK